MFDGPNRLLVTDEDGGSDHDRMRLNDTRQRSTEDCDLELLTECLQPSPADDAAGQAEEGFVDVVADLP
ncbi:hypothetical protein ACFXOS_29470, partial [Streptomyces sp. NPDC059175]|uniref:hypothetical protein n=1 Tax=Streptomyces sp. NPDC059175 TaxID=3346757 RepID=UPI00367D92A9